MKYDATGQVLFFFWACASSREGAWTTFQCDDQFAAGNFYMSPICLSSQLDDDARETRLLLLCSQP